MFHTGKYRPVSNKTSYYNINLGIKTARTGSNPVWGKVLFFFPIFFYLKFTSAKGFVTMLGYYMALMKGLE